MTPLAQTTLGPEAPQVPVIGLGLAAVGRPAYITTQRDVLDDRSVEGMRRRTFDLLDAAYAAGIRQVDVARSYGRAEEFLASWLADRSPDDVVVTSKWGYTYVGDWQMDADVHEVKDHSLASYLRQRRESSELLGRYLVVYQVHSATLESGVLNDHPVLAALAEQRQSGVAVGLSTSGPHQAEALRRALEVEVDGIRVFSCVQATWNLLERAVGAALVEARDAGCGVLIKEALANGRLSDRGDIAAPESALGRLAAQHGVTPDAVALATAIAHPSRPVVLSGAVTVEQVRSNLAALSIPDGVVEQALDTVQPESAQAYWAARSHRPWN